MSTRASRIVGLSLLGVMLIGGALVILWPTPVDRVLSGSLHSFLDRLRAAGLPDLFRYGVVEFGANVLLFVPLGFALALLLPRGRRWIAAFLCVAGSFAAEFAQLALRPERVADPTDVLANSIGGVLGTFLAVALQYRRERVKPQ
ncbi:MAG: VanZ family protein [Mycetocola sp.]